MSNSTPNTAAAIDLGSNSFHLIVARIHDGELTVIDRIREMVRLAGGLDKQKNMTPEIQEEALNSLRKFGQRLADFPPGSVRAVGTSTLRNAKNSDEFLAQAEKALGHPIDIISGVEEARLIYLGVSQSLAVSEQNRLIMDIGGSSTELIIGQSYEPIHMESLEMGCVTLTNRFFKDGVISIQRIERARIFARTELRPHSATFRNLGWQEAVGASGSLKTIKKVLTAMGWCKTDITLEGLRKLAEAVIECGHIDKLDLLGLTDERKPVFIGGIVILIATFEALNIKSMQVSDRALREGLLHDLLGRFQNEDIRNKSISSLAKRYHADQAQAQRVTQAALYLIPQLANDWNIDKSEAIKWLGWAADIHEIGIDIAHNRHHHHAAYIIEHSDMAGFSQQEQRLLAAIVRSHRRKPPIKLYKELPKRLSKIAKQFSIILRLAVILNRNRSANALPGLSIDVKDKNIHLSFPPGWLEKHALTCADLEAEVEYLSNTAYSLSFE